MPDCCIDGWRVTLAGSRFLTGAEERYSPVEGEALAVAWGLEQTKYFTQGCDDLLVVSDHKPLVKIFGDRTLDEITNTRLFRLKQRTLPWRFEIRHLPGISNSAADAASRHPAPSGQLDALTIHDTSEVALIAAIQHEATALTTLSWETIAHATSEDPTLSKLQQSVRDGFTEANTGDPQLAPFLKIKDSIYDQEGVLLFQDRVIIPQSLRQPVLHNLHAAHQGTSSMEARARTIVYWPGMSSDIRETRARCSHCNRNAPSQAAPPPLPSNPPATPFESIFADFFEFSGRHFLVVGDRLSGWVEVYSAEHGTAMAGATGLIRYLRSYIGTFGVPEEICSDGGPEFTASATKEFLSRWGISHRISSAYFAQSNGRAEVAVKTVKRLLMSNTGPTGAIDNDRFLRAMHLRNSPDPDCGISPAQIVFGRPLKDAFSFVNRLEKFRNPHIRPIWKQAWKAKENAMRTRMVRSTERLTEHTRQLRPLACGEKVFLQNQAGNHPTKWDRSGEIVERLKHDQYWVKVDGSGRLTLRNRRFLRAYTPASSSITDHSGAVNQGLPTLGPTLRPERPPTSPRNDGEPDWTDPGDDERPEEDTATTPLEDSPSPEPHPSARDRPRRSPKPRRVFEPETGTWTTLRASN